MTAAAVRAHGTSVGVFVQVERWFVMKRFFYAIAAALALLVPALTSAQVNTVYVPGAHPRVAVVPPEATPTERVAPALTPSEVIAMHTRMAGASRLTLRCGRRDERTAT
jgi:hypothetical protein